MIPIKKQKEPRLFTQQKLAKQIVNYDDLRNNPPHDTLKDDVCNALLQEQGYICAYCMQRIGLHTGKQTTEMKIEHIKPQNCIGDKNKYKDKQVEYNNFLAVCCGAIMSLGKRTLICDASKENYEFKKLNLLNSQIVETIYYNNNGEIYSPDIDIQEDINLLNLNCDTLKVNRKTALYAMQKSFDKKAKQAPIKKSDINRLVKKYNEMDKQEPYVGILLYYLSKKNKSMSTEKV